MALRDTWLPVSGRGGRLARSHDAEANIVELEEMLSACPAGAVYVSASPDFGEFEGYRLGNGGLALAI